MEMISNGKGLTNQIAYLLEEDFKRGVYPKGMKLPSESMLMQKFGVSRTVIREALRYLQAKEMISIQHGIGAISTGWYPLEPEIALEHLKASLPEVEWSEIMHSLRLFRELVEASVRMIILQQENSDFEKLNTIVLKIEELPRDHTALLERNKIHFALYQELATMSGSLHYVKMMDTLTEYFNYCLQHSSITVPEFPMSQRAYSTENLQEFVKGIKEKKLEKALISFKLMLQNNHADLVKIAKNE